MWNLTEKNAGIASEGHFVFAEGYLDSRLVIQQYSESLYSLLGNRICLSIPQLVTFEDIDAVKEMLTGDLSMPKGMIINLTDKDLNVWKVYLVAVLDREHAFITNSGERCVVKVSFYEYEEICENYLKTFSYTEMGERLLSLYGGMFIYYNPESDDLYIFDYEDRVRTIHYKKTLAETYRRILEDENFTAVQKDDFQKFYDAVKGKQSHVKTVVDGELFLEDRPGRWTVVVDTMYPERGSCRVIGIVIMSHMEFTTKTAGIMDSSYDPGTGVFNKRAITNYATTQISKKGAKGVLAILDVDDFKSINDNYGHLYGDQVLSRVANVLNQIVGTRGRVGRFGGDEFMIELNDIEDVKDIDTVFSTIVNNIPWAVDATCKSKITSSIGVVRFPTDGADYEALFKKADIALYVAKQKGKNRYILYTDSEHGNLVKGDVVAQPVKDVNAYTEVAKSKFLAKWILHFSHNGLNNAEETLKEIREVFRIDGISLYSGPNLDRVMKSGIYKNAIKSMNPIKNDVFLSYFDEDNWCEVSQLIKIEKAPEIHDLFVNQGNGKYIQCIKRDDDGTPISVVCFDFFGRAPKYSNSDLGILRVVGKYIADIL